MAHHECSETVKQAVVTMMQLQCLEPSCAVSSLPNELLFLIFSFLRNDTPESQWCIGCDTIDSTQMAILGGVSSGLRKAARWAEWLMFAWRSWLQMPHSMPRSACIHQSTS